MGLFDRIRKSDTPQSISARWQAEAASYLQYNRYNDALYCYDQAVSADPESAPAWHGKGQLLAKFGKKEESLACYDHAISLRPDSAVYYHNKGDALSAFGDMDAAVPCFQKALSYEPDNVIFLTSYARILAHFGRFREADGVMVHVCELEPRAPEHWFYRATMLFDAEKLDDAFACYRAVLEIAPGHAPSYFNCGNICREQEKYAEAVSYYDRALKYDRTMTGAMNNKGLALSCLGKHREAFDCFRRVLIALPDAPDIWYNKGYELLQLGYPDDAVAAFDTALQNCTDTQTELAERCRAAKADALAGKNS